MIDRRAAPVIDGLGPDLPELQKARALWQANRFDESLQLFEGAVRKCPQNLVALIDASRALGARFEIARAEVMLDKLVNAASRKAQVLHLAGQSYRMIFRPEKAIDCFQRALAADKNIPDAHLELAVLFERRHRLDEAIAAVQECLRISPAYHEANIIRGRLLRRKGDVSGAEQLFRDLTTNESVHPLVRAQAWTEIANALDQQGEYRSAMQALLRCKESLLPMQDQVRHESDTILRILRTLGESVTAEHFKRWAVAGRAFPQQRLAMLTSFPRSGTTLLEQVLDSHPQLVSSDEREAFARDIFPAMWMAPATPQPTVQALDAAPVERIATQRQRYLNYMSAALNQPINEQVHLDKNPTHTLLIPAMLRLFPETKIIVALRDPRDVVLSCFFQYLPLNTNSVCFLTLERTAERYTIDRAIWRRFRELLPPQWI